MKEIQLVFYRISGSSIPWAISRMALDRRIMKRANLD
ncbi:MAG: hypothetical protein RLZZ131_850, partial [Actinomycetota bacterium]